MGKWRRLALSARPALTSIVSTVLGLVLLDPVSAHDDRRLDLDFRKAPPATVLWGTLAKVGVRRENGDLIPTFLAPLPAMEGRRVVLYGYMTPRTDTKLQKRFLLSARPIFCGDCTPVGPEEIVEVVLDRPANAMDQPLAVRGTLALLRNAPEGLLFRLENAEVVRSLNSSTRLSRHTKALDH